MNNCHIVCLVTSYYFGQLVTPCVICTFLRIALLLLVLIDFLYLCLPMVNKDYH